MRNFFKILLYSLLLIYSLVIGAEEEKPNGQIEIKWKPVANVEIYRVELKYPDGKIKSYEVKEEKISLELEIGEYEYRIGNLNKLGRLKGFTEWHQLHVIIAKKPELNKGQNREITVPVREKVLLSLSGKNFLQDTKVFFRSTGKELKPVQTQYDSHEHLLVHLKPGPEDIGSYSIVIQNTGDKVTEYKDFLILKKSEDPTEKENKTASEHALYRSLLYPGTEQWYRGERTKGHILTGSTVFFLFSYFYFHEQRLKTNLDYQGDVIALSLLPLDYRAFPAAFLLFQAGQDTRQTTRKNLKLEKYALNALIGIYLYNTYDVFSNRGGFSFSYSSDKKEESFQLGYSIRF